MGEKLGGVEGVKTCVVEGTTITERVTSIFIVSVSVYGVQKERTPRGSWDVSRGG